MGVVIVEWEGTVLWVKSGRPIVTNGDFAMRLFPNYSRQYLFWYRTKLYRLQNDAYLYTVQ